MKLYKLLLFLGFSCLSATLAVRASVTTFADRTAWDAAVAGTPVFAETFDGFTSDTSLDPAVDLGPFSLWHVGGLLTDGRSLIDAAPFLFDTIDGTPGVEFYVDDGTYHAEILFDRPVWAFGADWLRAGNSGNPLEITAYDGAGTALFTVTLGDGRAVFLGFTTSPPESIERITLTNAINDGFRMDNLAAAENAPAGPLSLLAALENEVLALGLPRGLETSLLAKLNAAELILTDVVPENDPAAVNVLEAFVNQVEAQSGKKISTADADALIAAAEQIAGLLAPSP